MCVCACARVYEYRVPPNGFNAVVRTPRMRATGYIRLVSPPRYYYYYSICRFSLFFTVLLLLLLFCFFFYHHHHHRRRHNRRNHDLGSGPDTVFYVPAIRTATPPLVSRHNGHIHSRHADNLPPMDHRHAHIGTAAATVREVEGLRVPPAMA